MTGNRVFIMFEREDRAREVRVFTTRERAEEEKRRIEVAEALDGVPPIARSVIIIEEREVE